MGKPSPGYEIAVIGDDAKPLPPGKEGDVGVRISPRRPVGLFKEYWKDPKITQGAIRGDYYITGDRAMTDADGYVWFVGRAEDRKSTRLNSSHRCSSYAVLCLKKKMPQGLPATWP